MSADPIVILCVGGAVGAVSTVVGLGAGAAFLLLPWAGVSLPAALLCVKAVMAAQDLCAWIGLGTGASARGDRGVAAARAASLTRAHARTHIATAAGGALGAAITVCAPAIGAAALMAGALIAAWRDRRWLAVYVGGCGVGAGLLQRVHAARSHAPDGAWRSAAVELGTVANAAAVLVLWALMPIAGTQWAWEVALLAIGQAGGAWCGARWRPFVRARARG